MNGRDKVICVNKLEANEVANKVSLSQEFYIERLAERAYTYSF